MTSLIAWLILGTVLGSVAPTWAQSHWGLRESQRRGREQEREDQQRYDRQRREQQQQVDQIETRRREQQQQYDQIETRRLLNELLRQEDQRRFDDRPSFNRDRYRLEWPRP